MLHAHFCSRDEGIKKHRPKALKSMKIELRVLKIHSKSSLKAILLQGKPSNLNLFENLWFFNDFWLPKRKQNWRKNAENAMFKNNALLNRFLLEFSSLWLPKMEGKFIVFLIFTEKTDFVKIIVFPIENCYFSGFEPSNMHQISM